VFEAGADDLVTLPGPAESVRFSIEKALARKQGAAAAGVATGALICVLGPKGGTGKTLTACNLGVGLAQRGHRTAMVDLDLQFGDVGLSLGLTPQRTIFDLAKTGGSIDADKLDGYLAQHESGLRVLMAPARPDHAGAITVHFLQDVYASLRSRFEYVIVDTPPGFTPEVISTIDSATGVCMVGMLDSLSLKNTKLGLETLELMGVDAGRVRVVLNRADSRVGITKADVEDIIGRAPDVLVPSDRDIPRAVNEGTPIVSSKPKSEAARAFARLAATYTAKAGAPNGASGRPRRRLALRRRKG
jgi:pilus assembly protein CpaE